MNLPSDSEIDEIDDEENDFASPSADLAMLQKALRNNLGMLGLRTSFDLLSRTPEATCSSLNLVHQLLRWRQQDGVLKDRLQEQLGRARQDAEAAHAAKARLQSDMDKLEVQNADLIIKMRKLRDQQSTDEATSAQKLQEAKREASRCKSAAAQLERDCKRLERELADLRSQMQRRVGGGSSSATAVSCDASNPGMSQLGGNSVFGQLLRRPSDPAAPGPSKAGTGGRSGRTKANEKAALPSEVGQATSASKQKEAEMNALRSRLAGLEEQLQALPPMGQRSASLPVRVPVTAAGSAEAVVPARSEAQALKDRCEQMLHSSAPFNSSSLITGSQDVAALTAELDKAIALVQEQDQALRTAEQALRTSEAAKRSAAVTFAGKAAEQQRLLQQMQNKVLAAEQAASVQATSAATLRAQAEEAEETEGQWRERCLAAAAEARLFEGRLRDLGSECAALRSTSREQRMQLDLIHKVMTPEQEATLGEMIAPALAGAWAQLRDVEARIAELMYQNQQLEDALLRHGLPLPSSSPGGTVDSTAHARHSLTRPSLHESPALTCLLSHSSPSHNTHTYNDSYRQGHGQPRLSLNTITQAAAAALGHNRDKDSKEPKDKDGLRASMSRLPNPLFLAPDSPPASPRRYSNIQEDEFEGVGAHQHQVRKRTELADAHSVPLLSSRHSTPGSTSGRRLWELPPGPHISPRQQLLGQEGAGGFSELEHDSAAGFGMDVADGEVHVATASNGAVNSSSQQPAGKANQSYGARRSVNGVGGGPSRVKGSSSTSAKGSSSVPAAGLSVDRLSTWQSPHDVAPGSTPGIRENAEGEEATTDSVASSFCFESGCLAGNANGVCPTPQASKLMRRP